MNNYKIEAYTLEGKCFYETGYEYTLEEADRVVKNMIWLNKTLKLDEVVYLIRER